MLDAFAGCTLTHDPVPRTVKLKLISEAVVAASFQLLKGQNAHFCVENCNYHTGALFDPVKFVNSLLFRKQSL